MSGENGVKLSYFINTYLKLPVHTRAELKSEWDLYFDRCRESEEARAFQSLNHGMDQETLKVVRTKLKNGFNKLETPGGFDPEEWNKSSWGIEYRMLKSKIDEFDITPSTKVLSQTVSVW